MARINQIYFERSGNPLWIVRSTVFRRRRYQIRLKAVLQTQSALAASLCPGALQKLTAAPFDLGHLSDNLTKLTKAKFLV